MPNVCLLFLGTGTSAGVPMIACHCSVCTSTDPRDHRTRPSVLISYNDINVLIDTTPELRLQCVQHNIDRIEAVVYTHAHADHIMGLDDVRRFNAVKKGPLDVWADERTHSTLQKCFGYAFREPDPSAQVFRPHLLPKLITTPFDIADIRWTPIPLMHGNQPILGFRVGRLAYCTDVSAIPDDSFDLLQNLDVLVLDGLHYQKHPTHFSIPEAIAIAQRIAAKQTYFTHISHNVSHAEVSKRRPPNIFLSHDGLQVSASL